MKETKISAYWTPKFFGSLNSWNYKIVVSSDKRIFAGFLSGKTESYIKLRNIVEIKSSGIIDDIKEIAWAGLHCNRPLRIINASPESRYFYAAQEETASTKVLNEILKLKELFYEKSPKLYDPHIEQEVPPDIEFDDDFEFEEDMLCTRDYE